LRSEEGYSGDVTVLPVQVGNKVQFDWVAADTEYNRDRCSHRFGPALLAASAGSPLTLGDSFT
jgi:hypothetical protein